MLGSKRAQDFDALNASEFSVANSEHKWRASCMATSVAVEILMSSMKKSPFGMLVCWFKRSHKGLIIISKMSGLSTEPCNIPRLIGIGSDSRPFTQSLVCSLFVKRLPRGAITARGNCREWRVLIIF